MNQSELTYAEIERAAKLIERLERLKIQLSKGYKRSFKERLAAWYTISDEAQRQLKQMEPVIVGTAPATDTLPLEDKSA